MRALRLLIYFVVGLLLGTSAVLAHAAPFPATSVPNTPQARWSYNSVGYADALAACTAMAKAISSSNTGQLGDMNGQYRQYCKRLPLGDVIGQIIMQHNCGGGWSAAPLTCSGTHFECPAGSIGPQTINGVPNMCEDLNPCTQGEAVNFQAFGGWSIGKGTDAVTGAPTSLNVCDGTCSVTISASSGCTSDGQGSVDNPVPIFCDVTGSKTGGACSTNTIPQPGTPPAIPQETPPCDATEGVMTTSTGSVKCVPEGTPSAKEPKVDKGIKKETFPDGSEKITENTKTTDPATGATHEGTRVTNNPGPGGGTQSGTPGTTESTTESSREREGNDPDEESEDDADCDPKADFCGSPGTEGLYAKKDKSFGSVFSAFANGVTASPVGSAMSGFFTVANGSGGCPNWVATVPFINVTLSGAEYFCSATAINIMQGVGALLLVVASIVGFRWAFL